MPSDKGPGSGHTQMREINTHVGRTAIARIRSPLAHVDMQKVSRLGRYVAGR